MNFTRPFYFLLLLIPASLPCFSQNETEPNNKFEQCNTLTPGVHVTGSMNKAGDSDIYCIQVPKINVLNLVIDQVSPSAAFTVHIFNPDKSYLGVAGGTFGGTISFSPMACEGGTFYILVFESSKTMSGPSYRLNVTLSDCDIYECNNTFQTATKIPGLGPVNASIDSENDEDYFEINLSEPGIFTANVNPVPTGVKMGLALYDANKNQLTNNSSSSSGTPVSINKQINAGKHYVRLRSENISSSASLYSLFMNHSVTTPVSSFAGIDSSITVFPNPVKNDLYVRLSNVQLQSQRTTISLYNQNGSLIFSEQYKAGVTLFHIKTNNLPKGTYYIKVYHSAGYTYSQVVLIH